MAQRVNKTGSSRKPGRASAKRRKSAKGVKRSAKRPPSKVGSIAKLPFSIRPLGALSLALPSETGGGAAPIQCPLFQDEVETIVVAQIQAFHPDKVIQLSKRFQEDLDIDELTRRLYFDPIRDAMRAQGCEVSGLGPADMSTCKTVQDVADKFFKNRMSWSHRNFS